MKKIYFAVLPTLYAASAQANGFFNGQSPNAGGTNRNANGFLNANPNGGGTSGTVSGVPEISALEGTAALAAVAAILLFVWERRRSTL